MTTFARNGLMGSAAIVCIVASVPAAAQARSFDIPAQDARTGIAALGRQADVQIGASRRDTAGKRTNAVRGEMSVDQALQRLLANTGLVARPTGAQAWTVVVQKAQGETPASRNSARASLPRVQIASSGDYEPDLEPASDETPDIVVTAQKRVERLIDVPQSVTVLSSASLERSGATQFRDFASTVPGLSFATAGAGNTQVTLRGVSVGFDISPTVGIYVDEVPYGSSTVFGLGAQYTFDAALFDLDHIEVLRGPQGTLYGASTMGGLIKYVTVQPNVNEFGGTIRGGVSATRHGGTSYNIAGAINVPISTDKAGLRISGFQSHDGGFIDNVALGRKDVNRSDTYGGRVDLLLKPTDRLSVRLNAFLQNISRDGEGTADYSFSATKPYGRLGQFRRLEEPLNHKFRLFSSTMQYNLDWANITSISSYQRSKSYSFWDLSTAFLPVVNLFSGPYGAVGTPVDNKTKRFTQEFRLASPQGGRPIEWTVGGYYTRENTRLQEEFVLKTPAGNPAPNIFYTYSFPSIYEEYAAFGDITWHASSHFDATAGIRYAHNKQRATQTGSGIFVGSFPTTRQSDNVATYLANARYHFSDRATAYVRYATGYRPGGPNVVTSAGGPPAFEPDRLKSYEGGLKAESRDRRFSVDLSAFYIDWQNIQILRTVNGFASYVNASGGATIRGGEAAFTARPASGLTMVASLAYQDAHMSDADPGLGSRKGERLPGVPRFMASLTGDYSLSNHGLRPTLGGTVRHVGRRNVSFDASPSYPQYELPAYTSVDLRAGLTFSKINAQFYIRNLLDSGGQLSIIFPQYGARVAVVQPRTFGISLSSAF